MDLQRQQRREVKSNASPEHDHKSTANILLPSNSSVIKLKREASVVYYLSRNGQLEHPHFMEVPISSPQGLFLTDVINRLNALRGKGMASMYSWSCKRSYKNGFVWHDLSENDLIYPAHGNDEYVLKGSEIHLLRRDNSPVPDTVGTSFQRQPQDYERGDGDVEYRRRPLTASERRRRNQSCSSVDFGLNEYSVYRAEASARFSAAAADAATQTDDNRRRRHRSPHAGGESSAVNDKNFHEIGEEKAKDSEEMEISPPTSDSSPETLETLMKADGRLVLRPETIAEDDPTASNHHSVKTKSSVLKQLISCGSVSFKDCGAGPGLGLGLISQYNKIKFPRGGIRVEEKEYFSGSLVETRRKLPESPGLKRSTSYSAER